MTRDLAWRTELFLERGTDLGEGLRLVSGILEGLEAFLAAVPGLDRDGTADLLLVCDEIGSNIVRHVALCRDVRLRVEAGAAAGAVRLRLADDGGEFDPFGVDVPVPTCDPVEGRPGGFGLCLIRRLFPDARYRRRDGWNIVEVERAIRGS